MDVLPRAAASKNVGRVDKGHVYLYLFMDAITRRWAGKVPALPPCQPILSAACHLYRPRIPHPPPIFSLFFLHASHKVLNQNETFLLFLKYGFTIANINLWSSIHDPRYCKKEPLRAHAGAQLVRGEGRYGRAPPPAFHTLTKDMSLNRGAEHFTLCLRPCIIPFFLLQMYLRRPPLNITQLRPWAQVCKKYSSCCKMREKCAQDY